MVAQGNRYLPTSSSKQNMATTHEGLSAREVYLMSCTQHKCKPNSRLMKTLPNEPNVFDAVEYDMSNNLLGPHGILPVLELIRISPRVRRVIVRDNYLDNNAVHHIMLALRHHPSVVHVDVSSNPITWTAGMSLLELVTQNPRIQKVVMEHTHIKSSIVHMIEECIHRNTSAISEQKARQRDKGGNAASNSLCTRLMGLKRLFTELSKKEDNPAGKIHKRNIIQGYRENLRLQGREHLADLKDKEFWADLQSRCAADGFGLIDWETFFLISMCDDVKYEPRDVQRLKVQFAEFDRDKSGYIDLLELKDLMSSLNGGEPSHLQVHEKLKMYDADDSNTLTWDEFCLMMYEWLQGAPAVGSHGRTPATDMPRNHRVHHR